MQLSDSSQASITILPRVGCSRLVHKWFIHGSYMVHTIHNNVSTSSLIACYIPSHATGQRTTGKRRDFFSNSGGKTVAGTQTGTETEQWRGKAARNRWGATPPLAHRIPHWNLKPTWRRSNQKWNWKELPWKRRLGRLGLSKLMPRQGVLPSFLYVLSIVFLGFNPILIDMPLELQESAITTRPDKQANKKRRKGNKNGQTTLWSWRSFSRISRTAHFLLSFNGREIFTKM